MTEQNQMLPPPKMFTEWLAHAKRMYPNGSFRLVAGEVARCAYQAGADDELEACCEWLLEMDLAASGDIEQLRAARRPKPPSLKELALKELQVIRETFEHQGLGNKTPALDAALERLGELEQLND